MPEGQTKREKRRGISDTNYYLWRARGRKIGWPNELFDEIWQLAADISPEEIEHVKDEIKNQERKKNGLA